MEAKNGKIRAALYMRTSTVLLGQTVENQRVPLREYCKQRGFLHSQDREYADEGVSGSRDRRPQLDRMMRDVRAGKIDIVLTAGLDRLARNVIHCLTVLNELHTLGVKFISLREAIATDTPQGVMVMTVLAAVAQLERELIRQRIKESLAARKLIAERTQSGWRCGPKLKVTDEVVREILRLRSQDLSIRAIELRLDGKVSRGSIGRVVQVNEGAAPPRPVSLSKPGLHIAEITTENFDKTDAELIAGGVQG